MSNTHPKTQAMLWAINNIGKPHSTLSTAVEHTTDEASSLGFDWFHIQSDTKDSKQCLQGLGLPNEIIDALCTAETRPKAIQLGDGMLLYLRGINRNPDADPEDMVSLRLWIGENILISARRKDRQLLSVQDAKEELEKGHIPESPLDLALRIITKIADRISETVDVLDEDLTEFEALDKSAKRDRIKLSMIRRQAAAIRRYLAPQRDALDAMYRFNKSLNQQQAFELRDQTDRMTRYVEDLDLAKERAMVLQDELRNRIAEQQGMRMYVLSLVTAIFLPLSFLTGIFGMNVAGLPGTQEPKAFVYLTATMVILAVALLVGMLWKKWF
ncbi:zinc transporter ZntB [Paraglaciecola arctica]|uniref:zinc transporter ZntB n=1 Tax=Paraglaciecola arctica TaxID=1128911 RepID=UPI001C070B48|nr:zinc transporter ZntB [Paraglaciecola arctica]MBU3004567.1 zinc transporter ZntB [Paraglaciecola arctica]